MSPAHQNTLLAGTEEARPAPRPMTPVERAMLNSTVWPAECNVPEHGSVVNGALFFRRLPGRKAVVEEFTKVLTAHVRFRSLAKNDGTWEPVSIDCQYHFVEEPSVADTMDARKVIENIIMEDLDHAHPLWKVHLVPVRAHNDLSVLVLRVHHCIGDGSALASIFQSLARRGDGKPIEDTALMQRLAQERARRQQACTSAKVCHKVAFGADTVRSFVSNSTVPYRLLETDTKLTKSRAERRRAYQYGARRRVVYVPPFSLEYVKACKNAAHVSVNDVVFSSTSGALRRYCEQRRDPAFSGNRSVRARALIPVANPDPCSEKPEDAVANNFGFVSCRMALSEAEPLDRLKQTSASMMRIKKSTKAMVSLWQTNKLSNVLGEKMQQRIAKDLFGNHSLIFSNVPGPDAPIFVAGEELEEVQAIFPNLLSQVILLSYNGRIHMNFTVDPELVEDADALAACYLAELRAIGAALRVAGDPLDCGQRHALAAAAEVQLATTDEPLEADGDSFGAVTETIAGPVAFAETGDDYAHDN